MRRRQSSCLNKNQGLGRGGRSRAHVGLEILSPGPGAVDVRSRAVGPTMRLERGTGRRLLKERLCGVATRTRGVCLGGVSTNRLTLIWAWGSASFRWSAQNPSCIVACRPTSSCVARSWIARRLDNHPRTRPNLTRRLLISCLVAQASCGLQPTSKRPLGKDTPVRPVHVPIRLLSACPPPPPPSSRKPPGDMSPPRV